MEVVQAGEPARSGLDGVPGLVQELADAPVDCLGPDAEQRGDGDLGQGEALVEDGGKEPVGEGEHGTAAGPGGGQPGPVTAALVQAGFPLLVMQRHQPGDEGIPLVGRRLRLRLAATWPWSAQLTAAMTRLQAYAPT